MPPGDTERPAVNRLFLPEGQAGRAVAAHTPSPGMLARLAAAGFDPALLDRHRADGRPRVAGGDRYWPALAGAAIAGGLVLLVGRADPAARRRRGTPPGAAARRWPSAARAASGSLIASLAGPGRARC